MDEAYTNNSHKGKQQFVFAWQDFRATKEAFLRINSSEATIEICCLKHTSPLKFYYAWWIKQNLEGCCLDIPQQYEVVGKVHLRHHIIGRKTTPNKIRTLNVR